jgi:hypothetical protein
MILWFTAVVGLVAVALRFSPYLEQTVADIATSAEAISFVVDSGPGRTTRLSIPRAYVTFGGSGGDQMIEVKANLADLTPWVISSVLHGQESDPTSDWHRSNSELRIWIEGSKTNVKDLDNLDEYSFYIREYSDIPGWSKFRLRKDALSVDYIPNDPEVEPISRIVCLVPETRAGTCEITEYFEGFWVAYKFKSSFLADFRDVGTHAKTLVSSFIIQP